MTSNNNSNLIKLMKSKNINKIFKPVAKSKNIEKPKAKITHKKYYGHVDKNYPNARTMRNGATEPLECRFGINSDCSLNIFFSGTEPVNTSAHPFKIIFEPDYSTSDVSGGKVDANGDYTQYGMPDFYLVDVFNFLFNDFKKVIIRNAHVDENVPSDQFKPLLESGTYNVEKLKEINLFNTAYFRMIDISENGEPTPDPNKYSQPISVVITPYDKYLYAGYPLIFLFDGMGNKIRIQQTIPDEIKVIRDVTKTLTMDFKMGFRYSNYFEDPIIDSSGNSGNIETIVIYGLCNNNDLGISFKIDTTCNGRISDLSSNFLFNVYPYSNFNTEFPECLQPLNGKRLDMWKIKNNLFTLTRKATAETEGNVIDAIKSSAISETPVLNLSTLFRLNSNIKNRIILMPHNLSTDDYILI